MRRTIQTASKLDYPKLTWKSLDELDAGKFCPLIMVCGWCLAYFARIGVCDGMTYEAWIYIYLSSF